MRKVKSAPPPGADRHEFVMSDDTVDRVGDVIEPAGWDLTSFKPGKSFNPIALFNHRSDYVVGSWADVRVKGKALIGRFVPAAPGTSEIADSVRKLVEQNILRAVSVGFEPIEREPLDEKSDPNWGPFRFKKQALLECSIVSVPANPNAVHLAKNMNLSIDTVAEIFGETARNFATSKPGKPALPPKNSQGKTMTTNTLAEKINAAQKHYTQLREALKDLTEKDEAEFTEDETKRYTELPAEIDAAKAELDKHLAVEQRLMADVITHKGGQAGFVASPPSPIPSAIPADPPTDVRRFYPKPKQLDIGDHLIRALATWAKSQATKEPRIENVFREMYGNDEASFAVLKAAVNPANTTVAGWAAELVQTVNVDFLDRLIPTFIYPQLSAKGQKYTFSNNAGILKIPARSAVAVHALGSLAGAWVGEGAPKPVRRATFSTVTMTPTKLAVISTFTEEMAQFSNPAIERVIRQGMADDTGISLDTYLIDAVAGSATRPAGLLNGVTPIAASAAATAVEKMVADLKALIAAIIAAGGGRDIVILMNPAQAMALSFAQTTTGDFLFATLGEAGGKFNVSFIVSTTVPAGRLIAVDAADFASATGDTPRFAVSTEATLHEEDTTPVALGTTGSPNVVAAPMRSLFQTDAVAIRMTLYVNWVMRRTLMVQTIAAVTW